jgi:pimeloyl-ACP methyl ester carboxylesterase
VTAPPVHYTDTGGPHIAYQISGQGDRDLVLALGFMSHLDLEWDNPGMVRFLEGLAAFTRLIRFDKRGTGLSDRVVDAEPLEVRMDDVTAVMDAAGSERAVIMGVSEGAPMAILFAATYPDRVDALILMGGMARATEAPDYPWAAPEEAILEAANDLVNPLVWAGEDIDIWAPSQADNAQAKDWLARYRRAGVSPDGIQAIYRTFLEIDVREVLPTLQVPTLVLHRHGDRVVNWRAGRYIAEQIPGARFVDLPGPDHFPWVGDTDAVLEEVREFLTGVRVAAEPDRVLATVMYTDIVSSTERASALGDRRWRDLLDAHDAAFRHQLEVHRGHEVKMTGDGLLATFDGPARAIRCAAALRDAAAGLGIEIRVGLHTGEIEVRGDDIGGIAVHIGQRVQALAQPSEILVSSTVKDLVVGSGIEFEPRGEHELKGVPDTWRLFAVAG